MIHVTHPRKIAIVGRGRLGTALARRLAEAGHHVVGPLARDYSAAELTGASRAGGVPAGADLSGASPTGASPTDADLPGPGPTGLDAVLLCVPDREIAAAAGFLAERLPEDGRCSFTGHCSGASTLADLDPLPPAARFSLHPLMTFSGTAEQVWDGAAAALAASSPEALAYASRLARELGLLPLTIEERDRGAYHAAASMASNFLITLELAAERLAGAAGVERQALLPLVRASVENWGRLGAEALTGPIARGDTATVARQREAVANRTPELLDLFDVLARATLELSPASTAAATSTARVKSTAGAAGTTGVTNTAVAA